ncbi:MAG: type II secretion system secretin GspD [Bradyrhizobium sp.]|uniref:type II secretion system secretin GspD n=5 Tax=Bradyrhizobium sp. TaxID=376 RepID=UPI003BB183F8
MASVGKRCPRLSVGRTIGAALMVTSVLLLASCNSVTVNSSGSQDVDVLDKVRSLDILPRYPTQAGTSTTSSGPRAEPVVFQGAEVTDVAAQRPQPTASGNGFDLNFESAPVATVAKVVLGDIMQTGYTIDPRVQGTVSLVSVRPVPKSDIIFVLENALRISGVVLVRDTSGYRLTPLGDAVGAGHIDSASDTEPGYGVSVVPLQYVSAQTLLKIMDSFATKPGVVRADATRNLLLIQGTGPERRTAVETATSFDVDWMRGQSIGIFPVSNSGPEPIIAELEKIVDSGENGLNQNLVKLQPVARLNAVMVVTKKAALLHTVENWIKRLDRSDSTRTSVHVYKVKYGDAKQIARVLTDMFGGGSSSSLLDNPDNQIAPGSGTTASASDRLSLNNNTNTNNNSGASGNNSSSGVGSGFGSRQNSGFGAPGGAAGGNLGQLDKGNDSGSHGPPLLQNVRITPDVVNNSLLIYADQGNYRIIESALRQVDQPQLQVAINATIAEVDLTDELQFGVQSFLTSHALGLRPDQGSLLNTTSTVAPTPITAATTAAAATTATTAATTTAAATGTVVNTFINRAFPGFNFLVGQEAQPAMILSALHNVTGVKVLSTPSLVVINNQSATLQVGNQVPISTGSATVLTTSNTVVNTVDYKNTGIILHVSPRVSANGNVRLDIEQEISNVVPSTNASANLTPTISERKVKSSISIANGQTVLLAGLIQDQKNENKSGIPLLDELQGIGNAFSTQDNTKSRTELIIFIRPQIIRDSMDAHTVAEEMRSKLRGVISASTLK